jgi:4-amino-4-deoxy-L-arabinose transferase-like glycosyltransferase
MKKTWLILLLILIVQVFLRLPFLAEPLNLDEATYAQIAHRIAQGQLLYRDMIDVKPPALFFAFQILGRDTFVIRLLTNLYCLFGTILLFLIGRQLWGGKAGLVAALLYAIFGGGVFIEGTQSSPETLMLVPLLASFSLFMLGGFWVFLAGILAGLAVMFKQTAVFNLLAMLIFAFWQKDFKKAGWLIAGAAVFPLFFTFYFIAHGTLPDFLAALFYYSSGMVKLSFLNPLFKTLYLFLFENSILWILAFIGLVMLARQKRSVNLNLLIFWSLASFVGVYVTGYAMGHYFIQLIPVLCLLGGMAITRWSEIQFNKTLLISLLAVFGLFVVANQYEFYFSYPPDRIATERYGSPVVAIGRQIGLEIGRRTKPGDCVSGISSVVFYSGRDSLTRYYIAVQGGRSEIWLFGKLIYAHDFNISRSPAIKKLVDEDFYRFLSDKRTKYWAVDLRDLYAPPNLAAKLKEYGYVVDLELSNRRYGIVVFKRIEEKPKSALVLPGGNRANLQLF